MEHKQIKEHNLPECSFPLSKTRIALQSYKTVSLVPFVFVSASRFAIVWNPHQVMVDIMRRAWYCHGLAHTLIPIEK